MKKLSLMLCAWAFLAASNAWAAKLPVETFFKDPEFSQMTLSPDGSHMAAVAKVGERRNLIVMNLETRKAAPVTSLRKTDITGYQWATDDRLLFFLDNDGNESFAIYAVNKDGSEARTLIEGTNEILAFPRPPQILNLLEDEPDFILMARGDRRPQYPEVFKLNIKTGKTRRVESNPGYITNYWSDNDGVVRLGTSDKGRPEDLKQTIIYREDEDSEWQDLATFEFDDHGWGPVAFTADNRNLYIQSNIDRDTIGIYEYDPRKNEIVQEIYTHDDVDVGGVITSRKDDRLLGVAYQSDKPHTVYFDEDWKDIQASLDNALAGTVNTIVSTSEDETKMFIRAWSDRDPGTYYYFDAKNNKLSHFASISSWVKPEQMSAMKPIKYQARDGEIIHGYITLPNDRKEGEAVPLIVNPHGGPYGPRDTWGFRRDVQFLASRGYAVLQMNFRGSGGYGKRFQDIAYQKWGLEMQNDVTDGVKWAVEQGYANADKVCIYGASYGGYATMAGVTFTPDLYKCAVNYVGVVDLDLMSEWVSRDRGTKAWFARTVGDRKKDRERLAATSPINFVDKIQAPLYVVHGENDPRVEIKQARVLIRELKKHDKEYKVMIKKDEGHGFRKEENNLELYSALDEFLGTYLN